MGGNDAASGEDMRVRVLNALYCDLAVPRDRLIVNIENGWVTVSGMVDLPYQKTCAEADARGVPGVIGVTNLIRLADTQQTKPQFKRRGKAVIESTLGQRQSDGKQAAPFISFSQIRRRAQNCPSLLRSICLVRPCEARTRRPCQVQTSPLEASALFRILRNGRLGLSSLLPNY
jgi:BON domain